MLREFDRWLKWGVVGWSTACKILASWEGEAPAEPQAFIDPPKTMRFGRSLTLPSARIPRRCPLVSEVSFFAWDQWDG